MKFFVYRAEHSFAISGAGKIIYKPGRYLFSPTFVIPDEQSRQKLFMKEVWGRRINFLVFVFLSILDTLTNVFDYKYGGLVAIFTWYLISDIIGYGIMIPEIKKLQRIKY